MKIYCTGTASIRHSETGEIYDINSDDLDWSDVGYEERGMGTQIHYEAALEHHHLGLLRWGLWEYPVGIENYHSTDVSGHLVLQDFNYGLNPVPDEWPDYPVSSEPYTIFTNSYHHTGDLLADYGHDTDGSFLFNRMVFSHHVTAMEAYLCDTLINLVMHDISIMDHFIRHDSYLSKEKFTLSEAIAPFFLQRKVREYLRSVIFHNLLKVNALYKIALDVFILNDENKEILINAVGLRHDCVHRNGFDKDGNKLNVFTKQFVQDISDVIRDLVCFVEQEVRSKLSD